MTDSKTKKLSQDVAKDITYVTSIFAPYGEPQNRLLAMNINILPDKRKYVEVADSFFVTPWDIITEKVNQSVEEYYSDVKLSQETLEKLDKYGKRGELFKNQFENYVNTSKSTTAKEILKELRKCIALDKDMPKTISEIEKTIQLRKKSIDTLTKSTSSQLKKYLTLWEYENRGYTQYVFLTKGKTCPICSSMDGWICSIKDACIGKNLAPLHPNCDCYTGILNKDGKIEYIIDSKGDAASGDKLQEISEAKPKLLSKWKEEFIDSLSGMGIDYRLGMEILNEFEKGENIPDEKFREWGFADNFGISAVKLEYKLHKADMSVTEYDFNESNSRFETALDLSRMQAIAAGLSLAADSPAPSDKSDFDWHVEVDKEETLNWDNVISKKGETRIEHINKHTIPNPNRESHGVFYGNPKDIIDTAWKNRGNIVPIDDGMGGKIYNIPYKNAGYESGSVNKGKIMNYITIIVMNGTNDIITAFPSFGNYLK